MPKPSSAFNCRTDCVIAAGPLVAEGVVHQGPGAGSADAPLLEFRMDAESVGKGPGAAEAGSSEGSKRRISGDGGRFIEQRTSAGHDRRGTSVVPCSEPRHVWRRCDHDLELDPRESLEQGGDPRSRGDGTRVAVTLHAGTIAAPAPRF